MNYRPTLSVTEKKGVFYLALSGSSREEMQLSGAATTPGTAAWFGCFGFGAVAGIEPSVTFQAECAGRNQFLYRGAALRALAGRRV